MIVKTAVLAFFVSVIALLSGSPDRAGAGGVQYLVDTTSDALLTTCSAAPDGDCSLRGAITNANSAASPGDMIVFDAAVFPAPPSAPGAISINSTGLGLLPPVLGPAGNDTIDGTGRGVLLDGLGEDTLNVCLSIQSFANTVKGLQMTDCRSGIFMSGANSNTIGPDNLLFDNANFGIVTGAGATGNVIKGNKVGTNKNGTAVNVNGGNATGVSLQSPGNILGGGAPADRNIISGNGIGVGISGNGSNANVIRGNYIGTDVTGTVDLGNVSMAINIAQAANNTVVGGTVAGEGNLISGNDDNGIRLFGSAAIGRPSGTAIQGNLIGTDVNGIADLGNTLDGIVIDGAISTCIGGNIVANTCLPATGGRNVISGNDSDGVQIFNTGATGNVLLGNYIGTDITGTASRPNAGNGVYISSQIGAPAGSVGQNRVGSGNTIAFNGMDGVRVSGSGATGNTIAGSSIHSNTAKGIENVSAGNNEPGHAPPTIAVGGPVSGTACVNCTVDVYSDSSDEGRVYHGSTTADGAGNWGFPGFVAGPNVTATATNAGGSTSEFSAPSPADSDADGLSNTTDNCPYWPNPSQTMPTWALPSGDSDCDGFTDAREAYLTTEPYLHCAATFHVGDEQAFPDRWPLDFNDDQRVNTVDVGNWVGKLGLDNTEAGWTPRLDLNQSANGVINTVDVGIYVGMLGKFCSPSEP